MATITPTFAHDAGGRHVIITWENCATGDTITGVELAAHSKPATAATLQVGGTFAGGTTAALTGSNDNTTFITVDDAQGTAISTTTTNAGFEISTAYSYLKPSVTLGSADSVDFLLSIWT